MDNWFVYLAVGLLLSIALFVAVLAGLFLLLRPKGMSFRAGLRLIPDVIRLIRRLMKEQGIGRTIRIAMVLLLVYLVSPIDVIPDVLPLIGSVDDVILFVAVLRGVLRSAGPDLLQRKWPGGQ